jgi:hypothetical protein
LLVYFQQNKKGEGQGKEKCHAKSMMSKETNERLKRDTQHAKKEVFFFSLLGFSSFFSFCK